MARLEERRRFFEELRDTHAARLKEWKEYAYHLVNLLTAFCKLVIE